MRGILKGGKVGLLWVRVVAVNFEHPLRAAHASPSLREGEVCCVRGLLR